MAARSWSACACGGWSARPGTARGRRSGNRFPDCWNAIIVTQLLAEIRKLGYTGSANLLARYLNQCRAEGDRPVTTSRHASRLLLTKPANLRPKDTTLLEQIAAACPGRPHSPVWYAASPHC
ncbi:hypothetical protein C8D88_10874 [Lentzea atacamensis]|uniref:Uncharacterized protein n=1 Tax=Lentzea atacamensis TaxID=531938 RepID=A0A316HTD1_9PSEU|nr:hypothetical protein C8D88_10874 [Lentzea atacamensis]